jgi:UDP-galactopyranose mutase
VAIRSLARALHGRASGDVVSRARRVGIAGAGFSGAVVARQLADAGHDITVFDPRDHVAGNCHTARHDSGVLVHVYGPHLFHTASARVWEYVRRFGHFHPYRHRVRATVGGRVYPLPINLATINQFFGAALTPSEARDFLAARVEPGDPAQASTFEERALRVVGRDLYESFFAGYTRKQWGIDPADLPASVFSRLPVRFDYDDTYFAHPYQGIPERGYTAIVEAMLDHPRIEVRLGTPMAARQQTEFDHTFWTGPLDAFFDHREGRLGYRTIDFELAVGDGDLQGCAVMNHCDPDVAHTRVSEHTHLAPWERHAQSVLTIEFPRAHAPGDIEYYPIRLADPADRLTSYLDAARSERAVTFLGRLGTYRYLDMDVSIDEALRTADVSIAAFAAGTSPPPFVVDVAH